MRWRRARRSPCSRAADPRTRASSRWRSACRCSSRRGARERRQGPGSAGKRAVERSGAERFAKMIALHGGDARVVEDPGRLPLLPHGVPLPAPRDGPCHGHRGPRARRARRRARRRPNPRRPDHRSARRHRAVVRRGSASSAASRWAFCTSTARPGPRPSSLPRCALFRSASARRGRPARPRGALSGGRASSRQEREGARRAVSSMRSSQARTSAASGAFGERSR